MLNEGPYLHHGEKHPYQSEFSWCFSSKVCDTKDNGDTKVFNPFLSLQKHLSTSPLEVGSPDISRQTDELKFSGRLKR